MKKIENEMKWNVKDIGFLHPPDVFTGTFDNANMQERHERQVQIKLAALQSALARESDPLSAMLNLHKKDHLQFLLNNQSAFKEAGRLEEGVLLLYRRVNGPFLSGSDVAMWIDLFEACDNTSLYKLGDPVTFVSTTVYRGAVMGFKRSLSWSADREKAEWYADRWQDPVGGGEIYEVDITKRDVLIYLEKSRETEVIVDPSFIKSAEIRVFNP
jgi:hypothetical protein